MVHKSMVIKMYCLIDLCLACFFFNFILVVVINRYVAFTIFMNPSLSCVLHHCASHC